MSSEQANDPKQAKLIALVGKPKELFAALTDAWIAEENKDDSFSGSTLALIHNQGHGDAFKLAHEALSGADNVFDLNHILEKSLPLLDKLNIKHLLKYSTATFKHLQNDLAGGILTSKLIPRFKSHPEEAMEVINQHSKETLEENRPIFRSALIGLTECEFKQGLAATFDAIQSPELHIAAPAIRALGSFDWTKTDRDRELEQTMSAITDFLDAVDSPLYFASSQSLQDIVSQRPEYHAKLYRLGEDNKNEGLYSLSVYLFRNIRQHKNKTWFNKLLFMCTKTPLDSGGTLRNIDSVLRNLIKDDEITFDLTEWFTLWIENQSENIPAVDLYEIFKSTFHELINHPNKISALYTFWLTHEDLRYPATIHKMAFHLSVNNVQMISYDLDQINLMDQQDLAHLVRRTLGWIYDKSQLISLTWSLTKAYDAPQKTYGIVLSAFTDYIGYDYPHDVREFITNKRDDSKDSTTINLCEEIIHPIDIYDENLKKLPKINELRTHHEKYIQFSKARSKEMQEHMEKAQEKSIFKQIASTVTVKAGSGSFHRNFNDKGYSGKTPFTSIKTSGSLPRSEITDKIGSDYNRILFRNCKRGEQ